MSFTGKSNVYKVIVLGRKSATTVAIKYLTHNPCGMYVDPDSANPCTVSVRGTMFVDQCMNNPQYIVPQKTAGAEGTILDFYQLNNLATQRELLVHRSMYIVAFDGGKMRDPCYVAEVASWVDAVKECAPNSLVMILGILKPEYHRLNLYTTSVRLEKALKYRTHIVFSGASCCGFYRVGPDVSRYEWDGARTMVQSVITCSSVFTDPSVELSYGWEPFHQFIKSLVNRPCTDEAVHNCTALRLYDEWLKYLKFISDTASEPEIPFEEFTTMLSRYSELDFIRYTPNPEVRAEHGLYDRCEVILSVKAVEMLAVERTSSTSAVAQYNLAMAGHVEYSITGCDCADGCTGIQHSTEWRHTHNRVPLSEFLAVIENEDAAAMFTVITVYSGLDVEWLAKLPNLKKLTLSKCSLPTGLPDLTKLTDLTEFVLRGYGTLDESGSDTRAPGHVELMHLPLTYSARLNEAYALGHRVFDLEYEKCFPPTIKSFVFRDCSVKRLPSTSYFTECTLTQ